MCFLFSEMNYLKVITAEVVKILVTHESHQKPDIILNCKAVFVSCFVSKQFDG